MIIKAILQRIIQNTIPRVWAQDIPAGLPSPPATPPGWAGKGDPADFAELSDLEFVFHRIISALFFAGGLVAFAYLLIGGFKYLTSSGDEDALEMARKTITFAVLGLLIIISSWLILNTLGNILDLEEPLLQFTLPGN